MSYSVKLLRALAMESCRLHDGVLWDIASDLARFNGGVK